jgi:hypothetical protein
MHVLLLSMPDALEHTPTIGMCMPNRRMGATPRPWAPSPD